MDFAFSDEQQTLRSAAHQWLTDRYPFERVVEIAESATGTDPALWGELQALGWTDPDLSVLDTALLFEQTGGALLPGPLFSSVALAVPGHSPGRPTALAWAESGGSTLTGPAETAADATGRLTGRKVLVADVAAAELVYVVAADGVYEVAAADVTVTARSTLDLTRRLSELAFEAVPAHRVAGREVLADIERRAGVAIACEAVGICQRMLDLSAAHVSNREQFGRVIGTYQAVSHQVSDMYVALQLSRSLAYWAAWAVAVGDAQQDLAVAAATSKACEAARRCCEAAIQVHGGLGFTYDAPMHRYYKRAQWLEAFAGHGRRQRTAIARALLAA